MRECQWLGVAIETMSMSLSSTTLRTSWTKRGSRPCALVAARMALPMTARSASQMVVTIQPCRLAKLSTWAPPRLRTPTTATRNLSPLSLRATAGAAALIVPGSAALSRAALWRKPRRLIECIVEPSCVTPQIAETRPRTRWGAVRRPCPTPVLYRAYPTQCVFGFMDAQDCKLEEDALVEAMAWRFIAWSMGFFL